MATRSFNNRTIRKTSRIVITQAADASAPGHNRCLFEAGRRSYIDMEHARGGARKRERERARQHRSRHYLDSVYREARPRTSHLSIFGTRRASSGGAPSLLSAASNL